MPIIEPEFLELTQDLDPAAFWAENEQCMAFTTQSRAAPLHFRPMIIGSSSSWRCRPRCASYKDKALPRRCTARSTK
ncbi:MAG: hypothetical protein R2873_21120 [Caldilineaceae bacterium]